MKPHHRVFALSCFALISLFVVDLSRNGLLSQRLFAERAQVVSAGLPILTHPSPSGVLLGGTTRANIGVHVDPNTDIASCFWSTQQGITYIYDPAAHVVVNDGGISGLQDGHSYTYYVTCSNAAGQSTIPINFSVGTTANTPTLMAAANFDDGTYGDFGGGGSDVQIVDDPTNSGHGKVVSIHYLRDASEAPGQGVDRNKNINFDFPRGIHLGEGVTFEGDLYMPNNAALSAPDATQHWARKLLYWQRDPSGDGPTGQGYFSFVLGSYGLGMSTWAGWINAQNTLLADQGGGPDATFHVDHWQHIKYEARLPSGLGTHDGMQRLSLDGKVVYDSSGFDLTDANWNVDPSKLSLRYFLIGDQVNSDRAYDEYRYWDNVSLTFIPSGTSSVSPSPVTPTPTPVVPVPVPVPTPVPTPTPVVPTPVPTPVPSSSPTPVPTPTPVSITSSTIIPTPVPVAPVSDPLQDIVNLILRNRDLLLKAQSLGITIPPIIIKVLSTGTLTQADLNTPQVVTPVSSSTKTPTTTTSKTPVTTTTSFTYTRDLTLGSQGNDVSALQRFLISQNKGTQARALAKAGVTGYFGPTTKYALAEWQYAVGISNPSGSFGAETRRRINK